jgi:uncharacterized protein (TIGR00297 family)
MNSELKRKAVHIGSSGFAFLLRWLNWWQAALLALGAFIFNVMILPRVGGKNLYRDDEHLKGYPLGILLYPFSVLLLILCLPHSLQIVGAAWGIMAWGDGMASLFGKKFGTVKIPWNKDRSYAGSSAFVIFGSVAAVFFTFWIAKTIPQPVIWYCIMIPILATILAALIETIPSGLNDNLTVPISAGFFMLALNQIDPGLFVFKQDQILSNFIWGALINLALAGASYAARMVNFSGFASGLLIGTTIYTFGGYQLFLILFVFFFLGSAATKFGYSRKKAMGVAQEKGGARGWKNAVANCSVGAFLAILAMLSPENKALIFVAGFFGAFATAAADTVSSEIGQVLGKHPILITTLRPVPVGTEGAVSLEGTFAGIVASAVLCGVGILLGSINVTIGWICVIAGFIGTTVESYLGATLEQMKIVDNEIINFMNTLVGAAAAMLLAYLILF